VLYEEIQQQLAENPPVDRLAQIYFAGNKWWSPPERSAAVAASSDEPEIWENPFPDVTD
jgi:hypothetical protein